jgi:hypothetical protein
MMRSTLLGLLGMSLVACARGSSEDPGLSRDASVPAVDAGQPSTDGGKGDASTPDASIGKPSTLSSGLILHIPFENGLAVDETGTHPKERFSIVPISAVPDRFGHPTGAAHFTSTQNSATYLQVAPNEMPLSALPRALSLWVRPTEPAKAPTASKPHANVFVHWGLGGCTGKMFGIGFPGGNAAAFVGCDDLTSTFPLPVGTWSFVLLNYDSGTLTMVVDKQKKSKAISLATESGEFAIGGERRTYNEGVLHYFDGDIDDVRVWDRALTEAEIAALEADR